MISDPRFDPFAVGPSGVTMLETRKGRCMTPSGSTKRALGIPSICNPDPESNGECPIWAKCEGANVIMLDPRTAP